MPDVFLSYNREDQAAVRRFAEAFAAQGLDVWWDTALKSGEAYDEVTEAALRTAKAVVVLWSKKSVASRWVRAEATLADRNKTLVPCMIEPCERPIMFELIQTADLSGWQGNMRDPAWLAFCEDVKRVAAQDSEENSKPAGATPAPTVPVLAVLPFDNLSGDADLLYFSDGVSEEILQTVAQSTRLRVIGRSSSFQFRGADKAAPNVARQLKASHILDGSVRRDGDRIRIVASLIECASQTVLWSDRFDRPLTFIFALQDEIAAAIASALETAFAPSSTSAPIDPRAYDLYLKARAGSPSWTSGRFASWLGTYNREALETATSLAPGFAKAWSALAMTRAIERGPSEPFEAWRDGVTDSANRALALDPASGAAYAAMAYLLPPCGHFAEIEALNARALSLSPNDPDVLIQASLAAYKAGFVQQGFAYAARAFDRDPLYAQAECWYGMMLLQTGRQKEGYATFERARTRAPQFDFLTDFPMFDAGASADWETVDKLKATVPDAQRLGEHASATIRGVDMLRYPSEEARQGLVAMVRQIIGATGTAPVALISFTSVLGYVDDAYDLAEAADFSSLHAPGGRHLPGDAGLQLLFERHAAPLRRDIRFPRLCGRLGLCAYWAKTHRLPDCAEEAPYDFAAECEKYRDYPQNAVSPV